jgi:hypothetical protein
VEERRDATEKPVFKQIQALDDDDQWMTLFLKVSAGNALGVGSHDPQWRGAYAVGIDVDTYERTEGACIHGRRLGATSSDAWNYHRLSTFLAAPILGIATHPMTLRFPFDTLRMFETLRAGGFTDQQARTLTYVILDLVAGTPPIVRYPPPAAMIESRTQTQ